MYIKELKLERFRGSQCLTLKLHRGMNVFVGMNGTGKSSILDATAMLMSWLVNRIKHSGASGRPIPEADIKNGESSARLEVTLEAKNSYYSWNIAKARKGYSKKNAVSAISNASAVAKQIQDKITKSSNGQVNLPLFAYYPVNRAVLDIPLRIRGKHHFDLLAAYDEALTGGANFRTFFEWLREREDLENENRRYVNDISKPDNSCFPDPQLQAVRNAITQFMPDYKNIGIRRNPLRMEIEKQGERLTVNQLSDGEKCLMAMVGDMARRMAIANPLRDNPLEGEGVFLIDEIDLHLHPKCQRMVITRLTEVFPCCQFFISTHSPHVMTHVRPENLFLLSMTTQGLQALRPSESYGKTVERVLEDLMGLETTRPTEVKEALRQVYEHIDSGSFERAKDMIGTLEKRIGSDPELVRANVLIKRKELIGI